MDFSQSFSLGENTLNQLDAYDRNARSVDKKPNNKEFLSPPKKSTRREGNATICKSLINSSATKTPDVHIQQPLEAINESPTDKSEIFGQSIVERLKNATSTKKSNRKHFRRSKSDPVSKNATTDISSGESSYRHIGLSEDFGSMFDSTMEWNDVEKNKPKSKSKLMDKFEDDGFNFMDIQTQPQQRKLDDTNSSKETGIIELSDSSGGENINVSEIERLMKTVNSDYDNQHSFNIFSPEIDKKSQCQNSATQKCQIEGQSVISHWEDSAFFNQFLESQSIVVIDERDPIEEVLIDADCSISAQNMTSFVENEMKSCYEEITNEISKLDDSICRPSQSTQNLHDTSSIQNRSKSNESRIISIGATKSQEVSSNGSMKRCMLDIENLSEWGCTSAIIREYKNRKIHKMFEWQVECLSNPKIKNDHKNLVYSAPTSAGKTFVSEILMFQTVLQRKQKVLFILPFISVAREKMYYLQDMLRSSGIRAEGFFGGYTAPGGFESCDIAVCTIEKANAITNRLLEQQKIETIGMVVVDEVHLISDPQRGYILELLLAKVLYCSKSLHSNIQIVAMSATLPNSELLTNWLQAEYYQTDFRPIELKEMIKVGNKIYDNSMATIREISTEEYSLLENDHDNICQLCIETIVSGASVIVFCPSKDWCEKLALHVASSIYKLGKSQMPIGELIRKQIDMQRTVDVKSHLKNTPPGLDFELEKTISYGVAFHHAGLTFDERDIIETAFSNLSLRVIVATSTLSSGVNLPARRVIIRTPLFGGKPMNSLTYKQMIGRAGRMGKDTEGESILICTNAQTKIGQELMGATLKPLTSCLSTDNHTHLKRAILEVLAAGIAKKSNEIETFIKCTLYHSEHNFEINYFDLALKNFLQRSQSKKKLSNSTDDIDDLDQIGQCMQFLETYEFIRLHLDDDTQELNFIATRLGYACLASSIPPGDGFILYSELQKARQSFVLETELHAIYLVTPFSVCYQIHEIDWLLYLDLWEKLSMPMQTVGQLVGVKESFLFKAVRGNMTGLDQRSLQNHKRFYTALALQELINEKPMNEVAAKYKFNRGTLQSLQQTSSTFAGIVNSFCHALNWEMLALIVNQMKDRLFFGIRQNLIDLMKIPLLNSQRARALYDAGFQTLIDISRASLVSVEKCLFDSISFDVKRRDGETDFDAEQRNKSRLYFVTGKSGLTVNEAAKLIIQEARHFLSTEMGVADIVWSHGSQSNSNDLQKEKTTGKEPEQGSQSTRKNIIRSSAVKRKLPTEPQDYGDEHMRSDKRFRVLDEMNSSSDEPESNSSDIDSIILDNSLSLYDDEDVDFMEKFKANAVNGAQNKAQIHRLKIIIIDRSVDVFNDFIRSLESVAECAFSMAICKKRENDHSTKSYISGFAFCFDQRHIVHYLDFQDTENANISFEKKVSLIHRILSKKTLTLGIDDAKAQLKTLTKLMPNTNYIDCCIDDPKIAAWLLQPDAERTFFNLTLTYAPQCFSLTAEVTEGETNPNITSKMRACLKSCITRHILAAQTLRLKEMGDGSIYTAFKEMDMPIQRSLLHMERNGMGVDANRLKTLREQISDHIGRIESEIWRLNGKRFPVNSSRAVAQALNIYKKDGTQAKKCTRADLMKCSNPMAKMILEHRSLNAILSKSIQPLAEKVINNRLHGNSYSFTHTGRISMYEPNLQNVAKDFHVEFKVPGCPDVFSCRSAFAVASNRMLISADFCQLELRVLAHLSEDQSLIGIFSTVRDVFISIAAKWNKISETKVTDKMRNNAKQICYGIIYGMGIKSLAVAMNCDENDAETLYESFHHTYPGIRNYTQRIIHFARENGFVQTIAGRRRYIPNINSIDKPFKRAQAERQAINTTIQGSAADIAKYAILRMERNLTKYQSVLKIGAQSRIDLVLHLHDELLYEIPADKATQVLKILKSSMENCAKLLVPLRVKLKKGISWGEMKTMD